MSLIKTRKVSHTPDRVLHLTDSRRSVVSRKPTRNWLWMILSIPGRIVVGFWNWLMESKPSGYPKYKY